MAASSLSDVYKECVAIHGEPVNPTHLANSIKTKYQGQWNFCQVNVRDFVKAQTPNSANTSKENSSRSSRRSQFETDKGMNNSKNKRVARRSKSVKGNTHASANTVADLAAEFQQQEEKEKIIDTNSNNNVKRSQQQTRQPQQGHSVCVSTKIRVNNNCCHNNNNNNTPKPKSNSICSTTYNNNPRSSRKSDFEANKGVNNSKNKRIARKSKSVEGNTRASANTVGNLAPRFEQQEEKEKIIGTNSNDNVKRGQHQARKGRHTHSANVSAKVGVNNNNNINNNSNSNGFDYVYTNNCESKIIFYKYNDKLYKFSTHREMILQDLVDYVSVYHEVPQSHLYVEYNGTVLAKLDTNIFFALQNYQFNNSNNTKLQQYLNVVNASDLDTEKNTSKKEKNLVSELPDQLRLSNNRLNQTNNDGAIENDDSEQEQGTQTAVKMAQEFCLKLANLLNISARSDIEEIRVKIRSLSKETVSESDRWDNELDKAYKYVKDKLHDNVDGKKFYELTQCVAMVIRRCNVDDTLKIELRNKILEHGSGVSSISSDNKDDSWKDKLDTNIMNPRWDRVYTKTGTAVWDGPNTDGLDRGGEPYFCPTGWKRYGIKIDDFDIKYTGWPVCYHGSQTHIIGSILSHGILGRQDRDKYKQFFSPSIEYCAHPRYATPKKLSNGKYIQTVLQCRINPKKMRKQGHTLNVAQGVQIDKNFTINQQDELIEWYLQLDNWDKLTDNYVVYGIMTRVCDDPSKLPQSHWWTDKNKNGGCGNKNMRWKSDHLAM